MKEANKTGSISKLKGNRRRPYVLYSPYFYDSVSQKYKRSTLGYFSTLEEAKMYKIAYFSNNINLLKSNSNIDSLTFEEVYKLWLENKDVKKSTMKNYVTNFNRSSILHKMPIDTINGLFLQNMINKADLTKGSLRNLKSFWANIWDFAMLNDLCSKKNYPKLLKLPSIERGNKTSLRERIISNKELEILWNNLYKDKRKIVDIVLILCYTGLRIGELLNIKVKDIDLKEKAIKIINSKTVNGIRTIPIHDKLLPLITNRMYKGNEYLFTTSDNKHYKYDSFDNHFRILCKDLKLKYHTLHDTRHTFATLLVNAEVNKEIIIKMIGHKRYKTTLDIYVHKNYDDMKKAINQI